MGNVYDSLRIEKPHVSSSKAFPCMTSAPFRTHKGRFWSDGMTVRPSFGVDWLRRGTDTMVLVSRGMELLSRICRRGCKRPVAAKDGHFTIHSIELSSELSSLTFPVHVMEKHSLIRRSARKSNVPNARPPESN